MYLNYAIVDMGKMCHNDILCVYLWYITICNKYMYAYVLMCIGVHMFMCV